MSFKTGPSHHAQTTPDKPAYIMAGSGETVTFGELDRRSNQIAHAFRGLGLQHGDTLAIFAENSPRYFEMCWAAQRAGLYFVCISSRLTSTSPVTGSTCKSLPGEAFPTGAWAEAGIWTASNPQAKTT